jgi:hypothetical protein
LCLSIDRKDATVSIDRKGATAPLPPGLGLAIGHGACSFIPLRAILRQAMSQNVDLVRSFRDSQGKVTRLVVYRARARALALAEFGLEK